MQSPPMTPAGNADNRIPTFTERMKYHYAQGLSHPFFSTALLGSMTSASSLIGALQGASSQAALLTGCWGLGMGLLADVFRHKMLHSRLHEWKTQDSDIAKVLDIDYFEEVMNIIREENNFEGPCLRIEAQGKPDGTGVFQGGYFTTMDLQFSNGRNLKLMYKYHQKETFGKGALIAQHLRDAGHLCVPRTYQPDQYLTRLGTRMVQKHHYRGELYEYIPGDSLENLILNGEAATVQHQPGATEVVQSIFRQMRDIYAHPNLEKEVSPGLNFRDCLQGSQFLDKLIQNILPLEDLSQLTPPAVSGGGNHQDTRDGGGAGSGTCLPVVGGEIKIKQGIEELLYFFSTYQQWNLSSSSLAFGLALYRTSLHEG